MSLTRQAITITFIAGEDLRAGDFVVMDLLTGKLMRARDTYLCVIPRGYREGEVVEIPWRGGW